MAPYHYICDILPLHYIDSPLGCNLLATYTYYTHTHTLHSFSLMQASQTAMSTAIMPLVDIFNLYDAKTQASFQALTDQSVLDAGNITTQLKDLNNLITLTLEAQAEMNEALAATTDIMKAGLQMLTGSVEVAGASAMLVLQGLGIDLE